MPSLFYLHCCLFLAVLKVMQRMTQNVLYVLLKIGKFLKSYFTLEQVMLNNYFTSVFLCFLYHDGPFVDIGDVATMTVKLGYINRVTISQIRSK
jgi:hypothetical protein